METRILELVTYMLVSARNLLNETPEYGPLRLLEACSRLIDAFGETKSEATFADLRESIDEVKALLMIDKDAFVQALDGIVRSVTSHAFVSSRRGLSESNS